VISVMFHQQKRHLEMSSYHLLVLAPVSVHQSQCWNCRQCWQDKWRLSTTCLRVDWHLRVSINGMRPEKRKKRNILLPNFQNSMHIYLISLKASKIHVFMPPRKMWRQAKKKKKAKKRVQNFIFFIWKYAQKYRQTLTLVFEWPNTRNA